MKTLKFRITATVTKIETVEVDTDGLTESEIEDKGREQAHSQFNVLCDGDEEKYTEDSTIVVEFEEETPNPMCKKYTDSEAIPNEDDKCSLCGGDCVNQ